MIVHRMQQGSQEWLKVRLGIPTASNFSRLITPGGKASASAEGYLNELLAERLLGQPCAGDGDTGWTERGTALEDEARRWYAMQTDTEPEKVGFCLTDDESAGASPDAFVGTDGLLEIKCPSAAVHVSYLRDGVSERYKPQFQGQLLVTGRAWVDVVSYCPGFPPPLNAALVRVERDEPYIKSLASAVAVLTECMAQEWERLSALLKVEAA